MNTPHIPSLEDVRENAAQSNNHAWRVYERLEHGWKAVFTAQSFEHACRVCNDSQREYPKRIFCVNT